MRVFFYITQVAVAILLLSCEMTKEIDYETIYGGDKIVIHGYISPQDGVRVIIKKTVPPNALQSNDRVSHAIVKLFEDGNMVATLISDDGYFFTSPPSFTPRLDANYHIEVTAEDLPKATSNTQRTFSPVHIDSSKLMVHELTNYANLSVFFNHKNLFGESYYLKVFPYLNGELDTVELGSKYFHFSDIANDLTTGVNEISLGVGQISQFDSLQVRLYTLSPDLSEFLKSYNRYDFSREDPFFEQPYPVFSNIKGGYGFFASYSYTIKTIHK